MSKIKYVHRVIEKEAQNQEPIRCELRSSSTDIGCAAEEEDVGTSMMSALIQKPQFGSHSCLGCFVGVSADDGALKG